MWLHDISRRVPTRFTTHPGDEFSAVWSPDGTYLAFAAARNRTLDIYRKPSNGVGEEEATACDEGSRIPSELVFRRAISPRARPRISGSSRSMTERLFHSLTHVSTKPRVSFLPTATGSSSSNETGRYEVYAAPFQRPGAKVRISSAGGGSSRWRQDTKELFYLRGEHADGRCRAWRRLRLRSARHGPCSRRD